LKISPSSASSTSTAAQPSFGLPGLRSKRPRAVSVVGECEYRSNGGNFLDVKTLAAALTSKSHRLETLADYLGVKRKGKFNDFARPIDAEFIDYAFNDVVTTRECFKELVTRYKRHQLWRTAPQGIYSEAGLGKAYLKQMSVRPWREVQSDFDPTTLGVIMSSYFGGRAEVHIRRTIVQTLYCDFASMYPTVCTLMGLWWFVIAQGVIEEDATAETQAFLDWSNKQQIWLRS
jgi:hypothetical protein